MKAIVNVSESWGIGKNGDLLCNFKEDMNFFKTMTNGKIVIYGLNTLKSFPRMTPLKRRVNIVIAPSMADIPEESIKGCDWFLNIDNDFLKAISSLNVPCSHLKGGPTTLLCVMNLDDLDTVLNWINKDNEYDVFVCGGASIYKQLIGKCSEALITKNNCMDEADTFFPNLDEDPEWVLYGETGERISKESGISYKICTYKRIVSEK